MSNMLISESSATGEEINVLVSAIEESLLGAPRGHAIIGLLSLTLILMNPDITPDELQVGVRDTSQFICLLLEGAGTSSVIDPKQVN